MSFTPSDIFPQSLTDSEISHILNMVSAVVSLLSPGKARTSASTEHSADHGKEASVTEMRPVRWCGASLLNPRSPSH